MAWSHTDRLDTNHAPRGFGIDFGECSCRNTKDILGHAVVWSVHGGDFINGLNSDEKCYRVNKMCANLIQQQEWMVY
jgi:hypothetical protein